MARWTALKIIGNLYLILENSGGEGGKMMTITMGKKRKRREMKRKEKGKEEMLECCSPPVTGSDSCHLLSEISLSGPLGKSSQILHAHASLPS